MLDLQRKPIAVVCLVLLLAGTALGEPPAVWLPFPRGGEVLCIQGPFSHRTHKNEFAWDFRAAEGAVFVAARAGRVLHLIDDRQTTGRNEFLEANRILVDNGDGTYCVYVHHRPLSARVRLGAIVVPGTPLAEVGRTGTISPHLHFDMRGPNWKQTHDLRFRVSGSPEGVSCRVNDRYRSAAPLAKVPSATPAWSRLRGDEFARNGVALESGGDAFRLVADVDRILRGRVTRPCRAVSFYLWRDGERSDYVARAIPHLDGSFQLTVRPPSSTRGCRWYRVTIEPKSGQRPAEVTLPVLVEQAAGADTICRKAEFHTIGLKLPRGDC